VSYTLAEAAVAAGRDRSTLLRAIKSGKLSAARDAVMGAWRVDPAELARVYGNGIGATQAESEPRIGDAAADVRLLLEVERMKAAGLEARLADMERVVDDLRQQRDREAEERRRLTALLADRSERRRSWWPWRRA